MTPKSWAVVIAFGSVLGSAVPALAQSYRPEQFLSLDLWKAALSPRRLGPPAQFEPVPIEASTDGAISDGATADAKPVETTAVQAAAPAPVASATTESRSVSATDRRHRRTVASTRSRSRTAAAKPNLRTAHVQSSARHRGAARNRLARRHTNPLDAQAFDTRIQVWPCRSGGICNWQRAARAQ